MSASMFYVNKQHPEVEAWSITRLPFEPKGWLVEFRQQLRAALRSLPAHPQHLLHAVYASPVIEPCDTENILFYNVGESHLAAATRFGLRFERAFHINTSCPVPLIDRLQHYHRYTLMPISSEFQHWHVDTVLAQWSFSCDAAAIKRCASVWYAMKTGQMIAPSESIQPERYGIRLRLTVPPGSRVQLASILKPLFDGVISALQYHHGTDEAELSRRVAAQLNIPLHEATALLRRRNASVLGQGRLLHRWGQGIQWNPKDDACVAGELLLDEGAGQQLWTVRGEIFSISQA